MSFIKQVKTPLLPEVKAVMNEVKIDLTTKRYKTSIKDWLSPVVNLEDFYVYPINGITEGLNLWMGTSKYKIWREIGDYEWVENSNYGMSPTTVYRSNPSSIDGNFREMIDKNPVALDLAYVGTTRVEKIKIEKNIHTVFYSLSKPFGLNGIRTGWLFTRDRNDKLHNLIYKNNYYNLNDVFSFSTSVDSLNEAIENK